MPSPMPFSGKVLRHSIVNLLQDGADPSHVFFAVSRLFWHYRNYPSEHASREAGSANPKGQQFSIDTPAAISAFRKGASTYHRPGS